MYAHLAEALAMIAVPGRAASLAKPALLGMLSVQFYIVGCVFGY